MDEHIRFDIFFGFVDNKKIDFKVIIACNDVDTILSAALACNLAIMMEYTNQASFKSCFQVDVHTIVT